MRKRNIYLLVGFVLVCTLALVAITGLRAVLNSGITAGPDQQFGDQHLKTAVALIELHKVRNGKYPGSLKELKFTGDWDLIALNSVFYTTNKEQTAYYIEVTRGWVGKPRLEVSKDFWRGTGYDERLRPTSR